MSLNVTPSYIKKVNSKKRAERCARFSMVVPIAVTKQTDKVHGPLVISIHVMHILSAVLSTYQEKRD